MPPPPASAFVQDPTLSRARRVPTAVGAVAPQRGEGSPAIGEEGEEQK